MRSAPAYLQRFADRIAAVLAEDHFTAPEHLVRAKIDTIRLTARQSPSIHAQRRAWEKRMGELLLALGRLPPPAACGRSQDQHAEGRPGAANLARRAC